MSSNRIFNRVCCLQARVRHLPHRPIRVRPLGGDGRRHYVDRRVSEWRKTPQRELIVDLPVSDAPDKGVPEDVEELEQQQRGEDLVLHP